MRSSGGGDEEKIDLPTIETMNAKLVWFLLGALFASVFWAIAAIGLNERLMQVFYGFAGH